MIWAFNMKKSSIPKKEGNELDQKKKNIIHSLT